MDKEKFNRLVRKYRYSPEAVRELYMYYYPLIVRHIDRSYRGKVDGRDTAQQFFIRLFMIEIKEKIRYPTSWVIKISEYIAIETLRKDTKRKTAELKSAKPDKHCDIDDGQGILKHLDKRERDVIILRYWEKYTLKEIGKILDINYGIVKYIHKTAKRKLETIYLEEKLNEQIN